MLPTMKERRAVGGKMFITREFVSVMQTEGQNVATLTLKLYNEILTVVLFRYIFVTFHFQQILTLVVFFFWRYSPNFGLGLPP
jgi:hypothetical protein